MDGMADIDDTDLPHSLEKLANSGIGLLPIHKKLPPGPILLAETDDKIIIGPTENSFFYISNRRSKAHYEIEEAITRYKDMLVTFVDGTKYHIFQDNKSMPKNIVYTEVPLDAYTKRCIAALPDKFPDL